MWTRTVNDAQAGHSVAVAEYAQESGAGAGIVGIAMTGTPRDADATWQRQVYVLYLLRAHQGSGAGDALLEAVLDSRESAALWVLDQNHRAQAFYRRHGFVPDISEVADGVPELRMVRPGSPSE